MLTQLKNAIILQVGKSLDQDLSDYGITMILN